MGSKPELLQLEQGEKDGKFDEEKGAVATAERPTLGDDGQRDAVATQPPAFDPRDNPDVSDGSIASESFKNTMKHINYEETAQA
ncbi:hypothetical protein KCU67_g16481, partial [Aureobasidium melanogenum]